MLPLVASTLVFPHLVLMVLGRASHVMTTRSCPHARIIVHHPVVLLPGMMLVSPLGLRGRLGTHRFLLTLVDVLVLAAHSSVLHAYLACHGLTGHVEQDF